MKRKFKIFLFLFADLFVFIYTIHYSNTIIKNAISLRKRISNAFIQYCTSDLSVSLKNKLLIKTVLCRENERRRGIPGQNAEYQTDIMSETRGLSQILALAPASSADVRTTTLCKTDTAPKIV